MFTLPAILLSLGTGSDYAIHVLLRLKQRADSRTMREHLTAPLLVCAGGSVLGFASLTTAASAGLAQMGLVCSLAIGLNAIAAVVVMPRVWVWLTFRRV
jgi:predicted RND superfamily exporter protein